ncbi:MAG: 50S ribosomal protein L25 [Patescibacteria group bacterium]
MQKIKLKAQRRTLTKKATKDLRKKDLIPSAIFGISGNTNIEINKKEFIKTYKEAHYTGVIELELPDKTHNVLIQEVQTHPLSSELLSVSFHEVSLTEKINANVPFEIVGEAPAVKTYGGVPFENIQEIEIISLPQDIPNSIVVDISTLMEIGDSILLKDIKLPDGVEFAPMEEEELEGAIITISPPQEEEVEEEVEEVTPEDVEVINEKKEEDEEGTDTDTPQK